MVEPITDDFKESYDDAYNVRAALSRVVSTDNRLQYMASRGHRVIACAQALLPEDQYPADHPFSKKDDNYPSTGYCFVGLVSLEDPPKHGVREAIGTLSVMTTKFWKILTNSCMLSRRLAGIKVMMVTGTSHLPHLIKFWNGFPGDHPKTAEAIARKINLIIGDTKDTLSAKTGRPVEDIYEDEVNAIVIHGDSIDGLQGWQWDQSMWTLVSLHVIVLEQFAVFSKQEIVFARTSPQHKLEIGRSSQSLSLKYVLTLITN